MITESPSIAIFYFTPSFALKTLRQVQPETNKPIVKPETIARHIMPPQLDKNLIIKPACRIIPRNHLGNINDNTINAKPAYRRNVPLKGNIQQREIQRSLPNISIA
jgi:hypothetical protein